MLGLVNIELFMIQVKEITAPEAYTIRKDVLRDNIPLTEKMDGDFDESTINWNNQPLDEDCIFADSYIIPNNVIAGIPETWHHYNFTAAIII